MAKMPKARLRVATPNGVDFGPNNSGVAIEFRNSDTETQLAKDIADALRAKGYKVKCHIEKEVTEEY